MRARTLPLAGVALSLALAHVACAGARNPRQTTAQPSASPSAPASRADAGASADGASDASASASAAANANGARAVDPATGLPPEIQLPASGCAPDTPSVRNFHPDETALAELPASAATSANARTLSEGPVRIELPSGWFASRVAGPAHVAFRLYTGTESDALSVYIGAEPPVRLRAPAARSFRLALGPVSVRGALWEDDARQRLEAIALLPCAAPRFVHLAAYTDDPLTRARAVAALRTLRVDVSAPLAAAAPEFVELSPTTDRAALATIAGPDALALSLWSRARALRAHYALTEVHPLADQWVFGSFELPLGALRATVWAHIPVRAGRAQTPRSMEIFSDSSLPRVTQALAGLASEGCASPAPVFAADGVFVRCAGEPEYRALADKSAPDGVLAALADLRHARRVLRAWPRTPAVFSAAPGIASLCGRGDEVRVSREGDALFARREGCVLTLDPRRERVRTAGVEAPCAALDTLGPAPWARSVREGLHTDERGSGCQFSLGWGARGGYAVAAGAEGTASMALASGARGPVAAVDRRAVHTALGFVHDVTEYAMGRGAVAPPNVRPSVLRSLGVHEPGTPAALSLLDRFERRGGFRSAADTTVLGARALGPSRVEVLFLTLAVELTEEPAGWVVTAARVADPARE